MGSSFIFWTELVLEDAKPRFDGSDYFHSRPFACADML